MSSLYELTGKFVAVQNMIEDDAIEYQTIIDTLESIESEIEDKADAYAKIIKAYEGEMKLLEKEEERLYLRRKERERTIKKLKESLERVMILTGKTKFKTPLFNFNIAKNPPSLVIDNPDDISTQYLISQPAKVDVAKIKELLTNGQVFNFAHLSQKESLRIR